MRRVLTALIVVLITLTALTFSLAQKPAQAPEEFAASLIIYSDRPVYRKGNLVNITGTLYDEDANPVPNALIFIIIDDPLGFTLFDGNVTTDSQGTFRLSIPLPGNATEGYYALYASDELGEITVDDLFFFLVCQECPLPGYATEVTKTETTNITATTTTIAATTTLTTTIQVGEGEVVTVTQTTTQTETVATTITQGQETITKTETQTIKQTTTATTTTTAQKTITKTQAQTKTVIQTVTQPSPPALNIEYFLMIVLAIIVILAIALILTGRRKP